MVINKLEDNKYHVIHDGRVDVMTLDEVMALLNEPAPKVEYEAPTQEEWDEFWARQPAYPRM